MSGRHPEASYFETPFSKLNWPGNIRELENAIHRARILSEGNTLQPKDFQPQATAPRAGADAPGRPSAGGVIRLTDEAGALKTLADIEQETIAFSLAHSSNNITRAAHALGMSKSTFYRKLQDLKDVKDHQKKAVEPKRGGEEKSALRSVYFSFLK